MKKYIEQEVIRDLIEQVLGDEWKIQYAVDHLNEIPTADVVEVRHGRWQGVSPFVDSLECSECRYCITDEEFKTPYCPWCGAKMEE